uniref:MYB binding protein (P160) 1a n=1 Tax=Cyclopterus lumpus TaxID=8103 RepID=A0A8C2ZRT0_CYCLU
MSTEMVALTVTAPGPVKQAGILQQNRVFLDFFWDLAKPDQEARLKAVENLIQYLKTNTKADELEYTFKRLVDGLAHTRETARPGFSLALGQVLCAFEDIPLQSVLDKIKVKHNLLTVKKKLLRNAMFGNLFGVLAIHQSSRISKEPQVVLGCVQLLQSLTQHRQHLKDLPTKTMTDILSEVIQEEVFEEVLLSALKTDLASAFSTPEQLQLLLVALQRFPQTLKPKKLKKLLGSSTIINADNIPKLTEVLKMAAGSVKKECVLPAVVLDLLKLSLKEDSFQLFWNNAIINGMLKEQPGPAHYLSFRLLGSALPLLSTAQLKDVLSGEVMIQYGEHVKPDRFKLVPEMDTYVSDFLQGCQDADKQLAVMVGFSSLSNQGYPVVPSVWRVVQHLQPAALQQYVEWLKDMFLQPQLDKLLEFSTRKKENSIIRLRRWVVSRLSSIIDNHQVKKEEDLIMGVARFVFFHAFFSAKKASSSIQETKGTLSVPLDDKTKGVLVNSFFGLLLSMHHLPLDDDPAEGQRKAWDSRHIRQVCKTVFSSICPHVTAEALTAILDVSSDDKSGESDDSDEDDGDDAMEEDDDDEEEEDDEEGELAVVDQSFRLELMKVLQQQNALATEEDGSDDDDLDDDAMMKLDKGLAALFSEQKKKSQAKKDEKTELQKEKALVRDFKIKVLDLVEVFVARQAGSPLVLRLVEPLLTIIDRGMNSNSDQQEQDFLRRAADIFRNQLCRSKVYCRTAGDRQGELHDLLEKLMAKTQKLSDSSVCLYYFSASLYVVKVLRGAPPAGAKEEHSADGLSFMGNVDVDRVSGIFRDALSSFMARRKSPLTTQMFTDLFSRFPVLCVKLLDTIVHHIASGARVHQQGLACVFVLRAMQSREVQQLLSGAPWTELCVTVSGQLASVSQHSFTSPSCDASRG